MSTNNLFGPLRLGAVELLHRIIMAPLTRMPDRRNAVPGAMNAVASRIRTHPAPNGYDRKTIYVGDAHGYSDYPALDAAPLIGHLRSATLVT